MLAAGAVTVLAADIGNHLQFVGHRRPVAVGQHSREGPAHLLGHVVKPAVDRVGVRVIADRVTGDAILAVMVAREPSMARVKKVACPVPSQSSYLSGASGPPPWQ